MFLKIDSPEGVIFEGEVKEVIVPTESWEVAILPGHQPMVSVVVPGLVRIKTEDQKLKEKFEIFDVDKNIVLSTSKGILYVDGQKVIILTSAASSDVKESEENLKKLKQKLEEELQKLKAKGSVEEIEKALIDLQKITADLRLYRLKYSGKL